jgi:hypothetical protein
VAKQTDNKARVSVKISPQIKELISIAGAHTQGALIELAIYKLFSDPQARPLLHIICGVDTELDKKVLEVFGDEKCAIVAPKGQPVHMKYIIPASLEQHPVTVEHQNVPTKDTEVLNQTPKSAQLNTLDASIEAKPAMVAKKKVSIERPSAPTKTLGVSGDARIDDDAATDTSAFEG